jgi:hypothetical protein
MEKNINVYDERFKLVIIVGVGTCNQPTCHFFGVT